MPPAVRRSAHHAAPRPAASVGAAFMPPAAVISHQCLARHVTPFAVAGRHPRRRGRGMPHPGRHRRPAGIGADAIRGRYDGPGHASVWDAISGRHECRPYDTPRCRGPTTASSSHAAVAVPGAGGNRFAIAPGTIQKSRSFGGRGTRPSRHRGGMRTAGGMNAARHPCGMRIAGGMNAAPTIRPRCGPRDAGRNAGPDIGPG